MPGNCLPFLSQKLPFNISPRLLLIFFSNLILYSFNIYLYWKNRNVHKIWISSIRLFICLVYLYKMYKLHNICKTITACKSPRKPKHNRQEVFQHLTYGSFGPKATQFTMILSAIDWSTFAANSPKISKNCSLAFPYMGFIFLITYYNLLCTLCPNSRSITCF